MINKLLAKLYKKFLTPRQKNEDDRRRELILNILLLASIGLMLVANLINWGSRLDGVYNRQDSFSAGGLLLTLLIFISLYLWARSGRGHTAAAAFISFYFLLTTLLAFLWGIDLPAVPLFYGLIIIMAGVLLNSRRAFLTTAIVALVMLTIGYLQVNKLIAVNNYWRSESIDLKEIILYAAILIIIAIISWLFNHDLEKSLTRAQTSEAELKQERDLLEIKVAERTAEIKRLQIEKMGQLYRLAEFGRLASGIFHDLIGPLTALNLSLAQAHKEEAAALSQPYLYLQQSLRAAKKIEDLILALRKQLRSQSTREYFSLTTEIDQIIKILNYKLTKNNLTVKFTPAPDLKIFGDPVRFSQIILNLLSNAIDAYDGLEIKTRAAIEISLRTQGAKLYLTVKDRGAGIPIDNLAKIFEPFFTTKSVERQGLGLGLATTKNIVEKDFGGRLYAQNRTGGGAKFVVKLPLTNEKL